ncbi:hypothetical protein, partial [Streptomyces sp. SID3212]|uniref:hypothetical protein n=1 Tax=Streptomyces sp. SID3212 TaxID=2690259 RepID=UPI001367B83D
MTAQDREVEGVEEALALVAGDRSRSHPSPRAPRHSPDAYVPYDACTPRDQPTDPTSGDDHGQGHDHGQH